jgi:hypothetical protein
VPVGAGAGREFRPALAAAVAVAGVRRLERRDASEGRSEGVGAGVGGSLAGPPWSFCGAGVAALEDPLVLGLASWDFAWSSPSQLVNLSAGNGLVSIRAPAERYRDRELLTCSGGIGVQ